MPSSSSPDQISLAEIRTKIDALDRRILSVLEERAALAKAVVAAKGGQHVFRPGREADLIRHLIDASSLPPHMIEVVWRQIIANNITSQQRLNIALLDQVDARSVAGFCFGFAVDQHIQHNPASVIAAVASGQADLGVLPHWRNDASWLGMLGHQPQPVYIVAISPFLPGHQWAGAPLNDGVILARDLPDVSEADITLCLEDDQIVEHQGYHADAAGLCGIFQKR